MKDHSSKQRQARRRSHLCKSAKRAIHDENAGYECGSGSATSGWWISGNADTFNLDRNLVTDWFLRLDPQQKSAKQALTKELAQREWSRTCVAVNVLLVCDS